MNLNKHQQLAIKALEQLRGDDLERCQRNFRHRSPEQMQEKFGGSGETFQQILDGYQKQADEINAAIEWVKGSHGQES